MAQRRMFSKSITNSSRFLMMPQSAQNLYFHLGMNADDDGYCEHFTIMRMTESKPDDLKILHSKEFVKIFDEKVLVILDWNENNYIRSDRYTPSKYLEIYKNEIKKISSGIPCDNQLVDELDTQVRLCKDSIGKVKKEKSKITKSNSSHHKLINYFDTKYYELTNNKFDWSNKKYIKQVQLLLKNHTENEIYDKLQILEDLIKQNNNSFWVMLPDFVNSNWNRILKQELKTEYKDTMINSKKMKI